KKKQEDKDKAEWEAFLQKQNAKPEAQMRQRLAQFGFQENQIQGMIKPEKAEELQVGHNPVHLGGHQPTYIKVHKDYIAIETLVYFDIPWEYDAANPDYIIILRELGDNETDVLFEHTRRLRSDKI
ncbi:uncharacterized protein BDZ99DRAFT_355888, partial [Mytilinidion resinicola]